MKKVFIFLGLFGVIFANTSILNITDKDLAIETQSKTLKLAANSGIFVNCGTLVSINGEVVLVKCDEKIIVDNDGIRSITK